MKESRSGTFWLRDFVRESVPWRVRRKSTLPLSSWEDFPCSSRLSIPPFQSSSSRTGTLRYPKSERHGQTPIKGRLRLRVQVPVKVPQIPFVEGFDSLESFKTETSTFSIRRTYGVTSTSPLSFLLSTFSFHILPVLFGHRDLSLPPNIVLSSSQDTPSKDSSTPSFCNWTRPLLLVFLQVPSTSPLPTPFSPLTNPNSPPSVSLPSPRSVLPNRERGKSAERKGWLSESSTVSRPESSLTTSTSHHYVPGGVEHLPSGV